MSKTREQVAAELTKAIRDADAAVYGLRQREGTMLPGQFQRALAEARQNGMARVRAVRKELDATIARERQQAQRELSRPNAEDAARVTMYATQGMALAQAGMSDLEAGVRQQLAAGNRQAAREYLRAGGSRLHAHMTQFNRGHEFRQLEKAAASKLEAERAAMVVGLDAYAEAAHRLDGYLRDVESRLGLGDVDADPEATRADIAGAVALWHNTAEAAASEVAVAHAEAYNEAAAATGVSDL